MADTVIAASLTLNGDQANQSVKSFKTQLREANNELTSVSEKFGITSKEAVAAAKKVANFKDAIGDAKALAESFNPDRKFAAFSTALQGVTGGFAALQGVMGLFGAESKEVEKALLKVQSALALSQGVNALLEAKDGFTNLKTVAIDAFKGIKTAIGSTGIGLLVVALGAIYTYWDDIKEAVSGVSEEQKKLTAASNENLKAEQDKLSAIGNQDNILKLQGKSERDILGIKIKQTDETINAAKIAIQAAKDQKDNQVAAAKRNRDILAGILQFTTIPLQLVIDGIDLIYKKITGKKLIDFNLAQQGAKLIFDPEKTEKEADDAIKAQQDGLTKLLNDRAGYQLSVNAIDKKAADDYKANHPFSTVEIKKVQNAELVQTQDFLTTRTQLNANALNEDINNIIAFNTARLNSDVLSFDQKKVILDAERMAILDNTRITEEERTRLVDQNSKARMAIDNAERDQKRKNLELLSSTLGSFAEIAGKQTTAGKVLAVAEATINTYLAASQVLSSKSPLFIVNPFLRFTAAAATIITGLATVKKIVSVKVPGGGGSGSAPSIASEATAPLSPRAQVGGTQLPQDQINQIGNSTVRAFVVESDVSNNQERVTRLNRAARLGG